MIKRSKPFFLGVALACIAWTFPSLAAAVVKKNALKTTNAYAPGEIVVRFKSIQASGLQPGVFQATSAALQTSASLTTLHHRHQLRRMRTLLPAAIQNSNAANASHDRLRKRIPLHGDDKAAAIRDRMKRTYVLSFDANTNIEETVQDYLKDPNVESATPNYIVHVQSVPNDPYYSSSNSWGQGYADLWGLHKINTESAWNITTGSNVIVAVVDTGVDYTHPDIQANMWTDGAGHHGYDFVGNTTDPMDHFGHGTHVAGTIAAVGNNAIGVIGVAYHSQIMAVKGLDDTGSGLDSDLGAALMFAADNGAEIINCSWGGGGGPEIIDGIAYAYNKGVAIIAAAGNNGSSLDNFAFIPASLPDVITVSAYDDMDHICAFSNYGTKIDVAAPGCGDPSTSLYGVLSLRAGQIYPSSELADSQFIVGTNYLRIAGTSMATPHVAGVAALILSQHPEYSAENVRQVLHQSADDVDGAGQDIYQGYGRINAFKAVSTNSSLIVKITSPQTKQLLGHSVSILGSAAGSTFASYKIEYAAAVSSGAFHLIGTVHTSSVTNGVLETWNTSGLPAGAYLLKLTLTDTTSQTYLATVQPLYIDYAAPAVAITYPSEGAVFTNGQSVNVTALASDDVGITHVGFYMDGALFNTLTNSVPVPSSSTYLATAVIPSSGTHTLTVIATDEVGKASTATAHFNVILDTMPPTAPSNLALYGLSDPTTLYGTWAPAGDNVGVTGYKVDLSTDSTFGSFAAGYQNYNVLYDQLVFSGLQPATTYFMRVRSYDAAGNLSAYSATIQANTAPLPIPTILIYSPYFSSIVFGQQEIDFGINNVSGVIQKINYFVDAILVGSTTVNSGTYFWDSTSFPNGSHTFTIVAYSTQGSSVTASVPVIVQNLFQFEDHFDSAFTSWTVVDDGDIAAPSQWHVVNGVLAQDSAIHGSNGSDRLGTEAVVGTNAWKDYSVSLRLRATSGTVGVIFRRQDANNYYRFSLKADGSLALDGRVNGVFNLYTTGYQNYVPGQWMTVTVDVKGYQLRTFINGQLALQATIGAFYTGGIGLYTSNSVGAAFDDVQVLSSSIVESIPPQIHILAPQNGASLSGIITMSGTASDNVGVSSVTIFSDGTPFGTATGTGTWTYILDTGLLSNGSHVLNAVASDFSGNLSDDNVTVLVSNPGLAVFNADLKTPACLTPAAVCDSGRLLNSRGNLLSPPEANQPNTLNNSCLDGTFGTYHVDESNDRLKISTLDGKPMTVGKGVRIEATVWAYGNGSSDALDLYYAASTSSPTWVYLTTLHPTVNGEQVLSSTYTLPAGNLQAIRADFRYSGGPAICNPGSYDDYDDLVFAVSSASAAFVATDQVTEGTWKNIYGSDGFWIHDDLKNLPAYAQVGIQNPVDYTWTNSTTDPRALQKGASDGRIASCWATPDPFTIDINLTDGQMHTIALYGLDWDSNNVRNEQIEVHDATTNALLDTRLLTNFKYGQYLIWNIQGHVTFKVINQVAGLNSVISGIFFGTPTVGVSSATFVRLDTATQGIWKGFYGSVGYVIHDDSQSLPSYAQVSVQNAGDYTWTASTNENRALQRAASADRLASCWVTASSFKVDVNLTDGQTHRVALYGLDWDSDNARQETIEVHSAGSDLLLDSRSLSNFKYGDYLVWNIRGHVIFKVVNTAASLNSVISGLFIDDLPTPSAARFITLDMTTQGSWKNAYGTAGYVIHGDSQSLPEYAHVAVQNAGDYTWSPSTTDVRALQKAAAVDRLASCWAISTPFTIDVNLTDGLEHRVALYGVDWDANNARYETVEVRDSDTHTLLDSRALIGFTKGQYLVWALKGHVVFNVINKATGLNSVISGLFIDTISSNTASFVKFDTTTQGSWKGIYGVNGYVVEGDSQSLPAYAQVGVQNAYDYTWTHSTTDVRALQKVASSDRLASCWSKADPFIIDINVTDGKNHTIALYGLDWDSDNFRNEIVEAHDATTLALLDSRSLTNFKYGQYLVWTVQGHVIFKVINAATGLNSVISGVFLGVSTTTATGSLPLPIFNPPAQVGIAALLEASYPLGYDIHSFDWTLSPATTVGGFQPLAISVPQQSLFAQATENAAGTLDLTQMSVPAGRYRITVAAHMTDGQRSTTASAVVTIGALESSNVRVYPNPWRTGTDATGVTFDGLVAGSTLKLFTVSGHWLKTLNAAGDSIVWDLTNDSGEKAASGIYLYLITNNQGAKTRGKLVLVR